MRRTGWSAHLRGHFFLFDEKREASHGSRVGVRLLASAAVLELVRVALVAWLHPRLPLWFLLPVLAALSLIAVRAIAGLAPSQIGFIGWSRWSVTERSYLVQVVVLAGIVFPAVLGSLLAKRLSTDGAAVVWTVFVPYACYGFYQEVVYRGMVQRELVRRWSAPAGILVANLLYTCGPLHWQYFLSGFSLAAPMYAAIFAIGALFGVVYWRSGNLWLVAIFHAIGNAFILSSLSE